MRYLLRFFDLRFVIFISVFIMPMHAISAASSVLVGADFLSEGKRLALLKDKRIGLITNHTAINSKRLTTLDMFKDLTKNKKLNLAAVFSPEHGINGATHAGKKIDSHLESILPIYSLYGKDKRPTEAMLKGLDLLVYDIQEIGSRSYTYITTLFYVMEEASKRGIPVIVLDRPNPINGLVVDGPMLEDKWRSIVGYINVPYCHGMTLGELALFFNGEYNIGCKLTVIPMQGWKRSMSFTDTGLMWTPTSPNIPEATTPLYYPITGILGELSVVNIGVGYTLPFKVVGAPWIEAKSFAAALNKQKFPGVHFEAFHYKPFYGKFANEECQGVLIHVTDVACYKPVATQYLIIGILKSLYPAKFKEGLARSKGRKEMFCKVNGTEEIYRIISEEKQIVWKLRGFHEKQRENFMQLRKKYLIADYSE